MGPSDSLGVSEACFDLARELGDFDLARGFLSRGEGLRPADLEWVRRRIELELAAGAFESALELIAKVLADRPEETWALALRDQTMQRVRALAGPGKPE